MINNGDSKMADNKNKTNYYMTFIFDYKGEKQYYDWNMSFAAVCKAIRLYCESESVGLDGTDGAIWNLIVADLNADIDNSVLDKESIRDQIFKEFNSDIMSDFEDEWNYDHEGE
jgi:hypothetical protein